MIVDYSYWRPDRSEMHANGVIRYLSHDAKKAVSAAELAQLHGWGIGTALVFEDGADRAAGGKVAGAADGQFAAAEAAALGMPGGRPVYIAVDWDVPDYAPGSASALAKLGPVGDYLEAAGQELAKAGFELGVYGGYWLVSRALDAHVGVGRAWQSAAWSGGQIDERICLYQPGVQVAGGNADLDFAGWRDWGQWRRSTVMLTGAQA